MKDVQDQVISKINNVIVNNESESLIPNVKPDINSKNNSLNLRNVDNNVDLNKTVIPNVNATIIIDNDNNTLNDSTPLLYYNPKNGSILTNDTGTKETKADNVTVRIFQHTFTYLPHLQADAKKIQDFSPIFIIIKRRITLQISCVQNTNIHLTY